MSDFPPLQRVGFIANILNGIIGKPYFGKLVIVKPTEPPLPEEIRTTHGSRVFFKNHRYHRDDGPAVLQYARHPITEKYCWRHEWYHHGKLHRVDGPAMVWEDGYIEWYANGIKIPDEAMRPIRVNSDAPWFPSVIEEMEWLNIAENAEMLYQSIWMEWSYSRNKRRWRRWSSVF